MRVSLMPHVPHQFVVRRVENVMHRHRQLDRTEAGARVTADARSRLQNKLARFIGDFLQILDAKLAQILRRVNFR